VAQNKAFSKTLAAGCGFHRVIGESVHTKRLDVTPLTGLDGGKSIVLFPEEEGGLNRQVYREPLRLRIRESCPKLIAKQLKWPLHTCDKPKVRIWGTADIKRR
jgi:hypothetical protein